MRRHHGGQESGEIDVTVAVVLRRNLVEGTEAVAAVMAHADRQPNDAHLWAVIGEINAQLPPSDVVAKALTAVQRNAGTIGNLVHRVAEDSIAEDAQLTLTDLMEADAS